MPIAGRNACASGRRARISRIRARRARRLHSPPGVVPRPVCKRKGPRVGTPRGSGATRQAQDLVAGLTPGLSLKNCLFSSMKFFH